MYGSKTFFTGLLGKYYAKYFIIHVLGFFSFFDLIPFDLTPSV